MDGVREPTDLEAVRLLSRWMAARRHVDDELERLTAFGPAAERRVRSRLAELGDLEAEASAAFARYSAHVSAAV
jgi:hypothetical protein